MKYEYLDKTPKIDMDKLKKVPWLFDVCKYYLPDDGTVDLSKIPVDIGARLDGWLALTYKQPPKPAPAPKPESVQLPAPEKDTFTTFSEEVTALAIRERERLARERAVAERFEFLQTQGLLNTQANADAITSYLIDLKVPITPKAVDVAVGLLRLEGRLEWVTKPATSAPPPSAEPVRRLPNGEPELQLNANVAEMRAASTDQLRDLSRRRGEGRSKPLGQITSRF